MPYELSLEPDLDRGGHVYRAVLGGDVDPAAVRELSDWLSAAKQNPDASFVVDVSRAEISARGRFEMRSLMRRHSDLQVARRISIFTGRRSAAAA